MGQRRNHPAGGARGRSGCAAPRAPRRARTSRRWHGTTARPRSSCRWCRGPTRMPSPPATRPRRSGGRWTWRPTRPTPRPAARARRPGGAASGPAWCRTSSGASWGDGGRNSVGRGRRPSRRPPSPRRGAIPRPRAGDPAAPRMRGARSPPPRSSACIAAWAGRSPRRWWRTCGAAAAYRRPGGWESPGPTSRAVLPSAATWPTSPWRQDPPGTR